MYPNSGQSLKTEYWGVYCKIVGNKLMQKSMKILIGSGLWGVYCEIVGNKLMQESMKIFFN